MSPPPPPILETASGQDDTPSQPLFTATKGMLSFLGYSYFANVVFNLYFPWLLNKHRSKMP